MALQAEWKTIPGFKRFEINRSGIVRQRRSGGKVIKWHYCTNGYPQVSIRKDNGNSTTITVHKLVATTFIRNQLPGEEINHVDKNRKNPRLSNLEITKNKKEHGKLHRSSGVWVKCIICGAEVKGTRRITCSRECRDKHLWEDRFCKICGTQFKVRKAQIKHFQNHPKYKHFAIYCSNKCRLSDKTALADQARKMHDVCRLARQCEAYGMA
jgi:hypothetical protein